MFLLLAAVSCSTGYVLPGVEEAAEQQPEYLLLPLTMLGEQNIPPHSQPSNEDVLEALLDQQASPQQSEEIYNSLVNSILQEEEAETLQQQLNLLKPLDTIDTQPDIEFRKHFTRDEGTQLQRRKRSSPPYVKSSSKRRRMY